MQFNDRKNKTLPIAIRKIEQGDIEFVFNSWLKSHRGKGLISRDVDNTIYFSEHHKIIERILPRATTLLAVNPDDHGTIYGYLTFEVIEGILVVHYCYTKQVFRGMGVLRQLLTQVEHDFNRNTGLYSHQTEIGRRLSLKYNLIYHPYMLINYNPEPKELLLDPAALKAENEKKSESK
jgi:GNAT superfamily N-acetyltransferase